MRNLITQTEIAEAGKLATILAGTLRESGWTAGDTDAVTSAKVMKLEFQNGVFNRIAIPIGKLAAWCDTFDRGAEFEIEFDRSGDAEGAAPNCRAITFLNGNSRVVFNAVNKEQTARALAEVPAIRFDDDGGKRPDFKLVPPAGLENLSAILKANKAQHAFDKLRAKELGAIRALKLATKEHCDRLAILAAGIHPAIARARLVVKALRLYRAAAFNPEIFPAWLGDEQRAEHFQLCGAIAEAKRAVADFKPRQKKNKDWHGRLTGGTTPIYGPKYEALVGAVRPRLAALECWLKTQFQAECKKNGLPDDLTWRNGQQATREFSRARLAVKDWPVRKFGLAQDYVAAFDARRKAQAKFVAGGQMMEGKAIHADGTEQTGVFTAAKLEEYKAKAVETGARIIILKSNVPGIAAGNVNLESPKSKVQSPKLEDGAAVVVVETPPAVLITEEISPAKVAGEVQAEEIAAPVQIAPPVPAAPVITAQPRRLRIELPSLAEKALAVYMAAMGRAAVELAA